MLSAGATPSTQVKGGQIAQGRVNGGGGGVARCAGAAAPGGDLSSTLMSEGTPASAMAR